MQNNKVLKQRAKLYDDLLTCVVEDCGNKFSTGIDLNLHIEEAHHQKLLAGEWWTQLLKALLKNKDDAEVDNIKSGYNTFTYGELADAMKDVKKQNKGTYR